MKERYDVIVIGGGPAGLSAAISACEGGANVLVIEREAQLGGILRQCIHDGFGLVRYDERLTGPEYAARDISKVEGLGIDVALRTFVLEARPEGGGYVLHLTSREGLHDVWTKALVLATGCRERTSKQVAIHGSRPAGVFTAGSAQSLVNLWGMMPARRVVVLGSGDIGLIMARRLTLEGAEVIGVYEARPRPSGLVRNVVQCLDDFGIPLHLSKTVTRTLGTDRLEAVEICDVDERMRPIEGTEELVACDTLIVSVGLIPENELAESLGIPICPQTRGPVVDQGFQALVDGVFGAGNCLAVNDLVDYVSEGGEAAGKSAAAYVSQGHVRRLAQVMVGERLSGCVPQRLDLNADLSRVTLYLRADGDYQDRKVILWHAGKEVFRKAFKTIRQVETIRIEADLSGLEGDVEVMVI